MRRNERVQKDGRQNEDMKEIEYEDVLSCLLPVSSVTIVVENMCRICTTTTAAATVLLLLLANIPISVNTDNPLPIIPRTDETGLRTINPTALSKANVVFLLFVFPLYHSFVPSL
jgi:hypothetical protein